jgi:cyclopropane fatty-acyl-phospholipid synthase-like methyltransferase
MDDRMETDPQMAVGEFNGMGQGQFDYLVSRGLEDSDTLLEIGCGIFRAGEHFIEYLDRENYIGLEISEETIQTGLRRLDRELVERKQPAVHNNNDLKFKEVNGKVEFIIAHSVFSHTPRDVISECFENVGDIMHDTTEFYFTFFDNDSKFGIFEPGGFKYSIEELSDLASENGLEIEFPEDSYCEDERQTLARITKV